MARSASAANCIIDFEIAHLNKPHFFPKGALRAGAARHNSLRDCSASPGRVGGYSTSLLTSESLATGLFAKHPSRPPTAAEQVTPRFGKL